MYLVQINWNAISAISQVVATIVTVGAIIASLYIANLPIKSKVKIYVSSEEWRRFKFVSVIVNMGHSDITIKNCGIILQNSIRKKSSKNLVLDSGIERIKLEPGEDYTYEIDPFILSDCITEVCESKIGDTVKLLIFFMDTRNKLHKKNISFKIIERRIVS